MSVESPQLTETPDLTGAYPRLSEPQIATLERWGRERHTVPGELVIREGDVDYDFVVVLSGTIAILDESGPQKELIAAHGPRRFLGELSLLTGHASPFTALVCKAGSVLQVPAERLRDIATRDPVLGDLILRAFILRHSQLISIGAGFRIVGSRYSLDTRRLRDFASRNRLPHAWIDLEDDPTAELALQRFGVAAEETPVVIVRDGIVLRNPSNDELAEVLGLRDAGPAMDVCDVVVAGAGPAGLAVAVYGASEGLDTIAVDGVATGGQAATSSRIENYLGFPAGVAGGELADRATIQARKFGADVTVPAEVVGLEPRDGSYAVHLQDGSSICARIVVIATGARYRKLPVARLEDFEATCVYYAATQIEARQCASDPVAIVGGGNSAGQATVFLAKHAARVSLLLREPRLDANMSRYLADRIERLDNVEVLTGHELRELRGEGRLEAVVAEARETGQRRTLPARALFVFIGACPHTEWLAGQVTLDDGGYIVTGPESGREDATYLETNLPGVFAAGDVRRGSIMRVASAVGEGAMAIKLAHDHLGRSHGALQRAAMAAPAAH